MLRRWLHRVLLPPPTPAVLALPRLSDPEWRAEHQQEWARFLATQTGRVLIERLSTLEWLACLKAAKAGSLDQLNRAGGWGEVREWLLSLSSASSARTPDDTTAARPIGEPDLRDRLTP